MFTDAFSREKTQAENRRQAVEQAARKLFEQSGDHAKYNQAVKAASRQYFISVIAAAERYGVDAATYKHGLSILGW